MGLSDVDRLLLQRCLARTPGAWEEFVDRFLGLVVHVVNHSAQLRSIQLSAEDREDIVAETFMTIVKDDFGVLRRFRGESSLATYLTVVCRRIIVRSIVKHRMPAVAEEDSEPADPHPPSEQQLGDREEVERLVQTLNEQEANIVRMYYLEDKTYHEISEALGISENTIGPTLSRAREKMRSLGVNEG